MIQVTSSQLFAALKEDGADQETIESFINYHKKNRDIWDNFLKLSLEAKDAGQRLGAKCIAECVRYNCVIRDKGQYKVSNTWIPYYARLFNLAVGEEYFNCKKLVGVSERVSADEIV